MELVIFWAIALAVVFVFLGIGTVICR